MLPRLLPPTFSLFSLFSLLPLTACYGVVDSKEAERADHSVPRVVLSGNTLIEALGASEAITAPTPFVRIGATWTGVGNANIEITTSPDGSNWSRWSPLGVHHSELESEAIFTGDVWSISETGDRYYMLRAGDRALPESLTLEFFAQTTGEDIESGSEFMPLAGESTAPIQIGAAQVMPRAAWNARAPRCSSGHTPRRMTLHHTEQPNNSNLSAPALLRSVQGFHQNTRGWCDIGYHFLVSADGRIWQGRPANRLGSHAGAGNNTGNIGIALIGNYVDERPTDAQLASVAALMRGLAQEYAIPLDAAHFAGHRDMRATECPGDAAYALLGDLLALARGDSEELPPLPQPDEVRLVGAVYRDGHMSERLANASVTVDGAAIEVDAFGFFETRVTTGATVNIEVSAPGFDSTQFSRVAATDPTWGSIGLVTAGASTGSAGMQGVIYTGGSGENRIGNAVITLDNGRSAVATQSGYWRISNLAPGAYSVTASAPGFQTRTVARSAESGDLTWASVELTAGMDVGAEISGPSCAADCGSPEPLFDGGACYCDTACEKVGDCCESYFAECR